MKKLKILLIFLMIAGLSGCKQSFFDVNKPSNKIDEETVPVQTQLTYIEYQLGNLHFSIASATAQYSQQLASYHVAGADIHEKTSLSGAWLRYYTRILANLRVLERKAEKDNSVYYLAIGKILRVMATQLATDQWGDIPYTEAGYGSANLTPAVDPQQKIYQDDLLPALDEAIALLQSGNSVAPVPGSDDIFYGGDLDRWLKAAYTLKARILLHLTKRFGTQYTDDIVAALQHGITDNAEDMEVYYGGTDLNPWYSWAVAARNTGNLSVLWSEQLIGFMNNTRIPLDSLDYDPRLPLYADNEGDSLYVGAVNGSGGTVGPNGLSPNANVANASYFTETSPIFILTNMEARFIEAEAQMLAGNKQAAYQAYMAGIQASLQKTGVTPGDIDAYLAEPAVNLNGNADNLTLSHIMVQKFIALIVHPEIWTDLRRYDFSSDIYPDLDFPMNRTDEIPADEWPRRAVYPESEVSRNPNLEQITEYWAPVWWDQH